MPVIMPTDRQAEALDGLQRALDACRAAGVAAIPDADAAGPDGVSLLIRRGRRWVRVGHAVLPSIPAPADPAVHVIGGVS